MSILVKYIFRFIILVAIQVFVLDKVLLHQLIVPSIYFLFILWLPFRMERYWVMILAFVLGITVDYFQHSPGFHAAACVLIAYLRPFLINIFISKEGAEYNYESPGITSFGGFIPYIIFASILCFIHNAWLYFLQAWQFGNPILFLGKCLLSTIISLLLITIIELSLSRKEKFRTNTN